MTTYVSESDLILINAYLDGELAVGERAAFEQRLAGDPALQHELESLRVTVALLGMAERQRVPRNFTLDPKVYGRPARPNLWERIGLRDMPRLMTAGAMIVATFACAGAIILRAGSQGYFGAKMAGAPAPVEVAEQAAEPTLAAADEGAERFAGMTAEEPGALEMEALEAPTEAPPAGGGEGAQDTGEAAVSETPTPLTTTFADETRQPAAGAEVGTAVAQAPDEAAAEDDAQRDSDTGAAQPPVAPWVFLGAGLLAVAGLTAAGLAAYVLARRARQR